MLRKGPFCKSLLDLPLLPSRHVLGIALLQRSDVFALSSAADALKQLGLEASSLAGAFVIVSEAGGLRQRKLGACANGDASNIVVDYDGKSNVALAVDSVLDRDLTEQQWRQVEADYCSRLLAGHAEPVTLRQVAGAFARLNRLHRCWLLLRNAAAQAPAPATPAGGGPVISAWQGGAMPPAAGASVPTPTQMPHVLDEARREQLLQALERPAFNDCKLLDWLGRVVPWDEGLAMEYMELASSSLQQPLGPQLPDAAAAGPQAQQEEQLQKHPLIDQDGMKQQQERQRAVSAEESGDPSLARRLAPRAAAEAGTAAVAVEALPGEAQRDLAAGQKVEAQEAQGQTATGQRAQGRKAGSDAQHPQHLAKAVVCPVSPPADPVPQSGAPHVPSQAPPGATAAPLLPPAGATGALPASRACAAAASSAAVLGTTGGAPEAPGMGPQQEATGGQRRPRSRPSIHFMPAAKGSGDQQQQAAGCEQLEPGPPAATGPSPRAASPIGTAAISSRQPQQPVNAAAGVPLSHLSEQKQIGRGRASDARQEEENRSRQRRSRSPVCIRDRDSSRPSSRSRPRSRPRSCSLTRSPSRARPRSRLRSRSPSHARSRLRSRSCSHTRSRSRSPSRSRSRAHECADTHTQSPPDRRQDSWDVRAEEVAWARRLHEWLLGEPDRTAAVPRILRMKMGVPVRVLATTRLKPIVFWEGYPGLWEFLPGTRETPPALRARPPVGGAAPLVAVAAVERQPLLTPAQMEVAYIRRLYTFLLTRTGGAETGDFLRLSINVPNAVLCGRRVTAFLQSYEDAGVLELSSSGGDRDSVVVRAVAGPRAEAALQEACERLLKQDRRKEG